MPVCCVTVCVCVCTYCMLESVDLSTQLSLTTTPSWHSVKPLLPSLVPISMVEQMIAKLQWCHFFLQPSGTPIFSSPSQTFFYYSLLPKHSAQVLMSFRVHYQWELLTCCAFITSTFLLTADISFYGSFKNILLMLQPAVQSQSVIGFELLYIFDALDCALCHFSFQ